MDFEGAHAHLVPGVLKTNVEVLEKASLEAINVYTNWQRDQNAQWQEAALEALAEVLRKLAERIEEEAIVKSNPHLYAAAMELKTKFPPYLLGKEDQGRPAKTQTRLFHDYKAYPVSGFVEVLTHPEVIETLFSQGGANAKKAAERALDIMRRPDGKIPPPPSGGLLLMG